MMKDEFFMKRAIEVAKRGEGRVSPNPFAGAIFVRNKKIIAEGWHQKFGGDHAEIVALKHAAKRGVNLRGATLYINLEPCVHAGKTPPCAPELVKSKIARVVCGMADPNPRVKGRGIRELEAAGIKVSVGCLKELAMELNEKFVKWMTKKMPFIGMKVAMSLDGKIAARTGDAKWITSESSREHVKILRDQYDAILVGCRTVIKDNPVLKGRESEPRRIILDSELCISKAANVLRDNNVLVITTRKASKSKLKAFAVRNIPVKIFPEKISVSPLLRYLASCGISSVFVEGGSEIFGSFVDSKAVDRLYWFIAPKIIGGRNARTAVAGRGAARLKQALNLKNLSFKSMGPDIFLEAKPAAARRGRLSVHAPSYECESASRVPQAPLVKLPLL